MEKTDVYVWDDNAGILKSYQESARISKLLNLYAQPGTDTASSLILLPKSIVLIDWQVWTAKASVYARNGPQCGLDIFKTLLPQLLQSHARAVVFGTSFGEELLAETPAEIMSCDFLPAYAIGKDRNPQEVGEKMISTLEELVENPIILRSRLLNKRALDKSSLLVSGSNY